MWTGKLIRDRHGIAKCTQAITWKQPDGEASEGKLFGEKV